MPNSNSQISEGRQGLYYGGMALTLIGIVMFLSVLVSGIASVNPARNRVPRTTVWVSPGNEDIGKYGGLLGIPSDAEIRVGSPGNSSPTSGSSPFGADRSPNPMTALFGMGLIIVGGIMMNVGHAGLRGSGIILDPQGAREDLKPWNQAAGGMLDDTLAASPIVSRAVENMGNSGAPHHDPQIRVRCLKCGALNDEDAKFCDECGASLH